MRTVDDIKGLRIRFASVTIKSFIAALGGTPVGVPPSGIADALQKNTIDGCFVDYGGAHTAIPPRRARQIHYRNVLLCQQLRRGDESRTFANLPPDLQKMIEDTTRPRIEPGRQAMGFRRRARQDISLSEGDTPIVLSKEQDALLKKIGADDTAKVLAELDGKGLPATKVHAAMNAAAAKYAKTSFSFWKT